MIKLLEEYTAVLSGGQAAEKARNPRSRSYYIAADTVSGSEWLGFEHVYQVHCPRLFLNESVRDVRPLDINRSLTLDLPYLLDPDAVLLLFARKERIRIPARDTVRHTARRTLTPLMFDLGL